MSRNGNLCSNKKLATTRFFRGGVIIDYNHFWITIVSQAWRTVELILAFGHSEKLLCYVQKQFFDTPIRLGRGLIMRRSYRF